MKRFESFLFSVLILILILSCSGGSGMNPVMPVNEIETAQSEVGGGTDSTSNPASRYLLGYYTMIYDPEGGAVEVVPGREASGHWNVLNFLESWPCTNCVHVTEVVDLGDGTLLFPVEITHPFPNLNLSGFDVRGIAMFEGGYEFPTMSQTIPDADAGTGQLMNPDGFTSLYGEWTIPLSPPALQTYIPGKFSSDTIPNATINGFIRYSTFDAANTRRAFYAGDTVSGAYIIDMPDGGFVFGYAVDASWVPATTLPVTDPITDFPPEANAPEPWELLLEVDPIGPGLNLGGGAVELIISVRDNEPGTHQVPYIECPDLFSGTEMAVLETEYGNTSQYRVVISNTENPAPIEGDFPVLVRVRDNLYGTTDEWIDLTAYNVATVHVEATTHSGWVRTWGGTGNESSSCVETDKYGNVYVGGYFIGTVDFDPSSEIDNHTSTSDSADCFLTRYDNQGTYQWTLTWGGSGTDGVNDIAIDNKGNIYVVGQWENGIDLDPDPDKSWIYSSVGNPEGFISKFNLAGTFQWGQNIHGTGGERMYGATTDISNNLYVTGTFDGLASFDAEESDHYTPVGQSDAFIGMYGANGQLIFAHTLGSDGNDYGNAIVTANSVDYVIWTGAFGENSGGAPVDFDPNPDLEDLHTSHGGLDVFVVKYNATTNYLGGISFGGISSDYGHGVTVSNDMIYVAGSFMSTVDFDPGPGNGERTSAGQIDAFVAKYASNFLFQWVQTWGGPVDDLAEDVEVDSYGALYTCGTFRETVDFDPGSGVENVTSAGQMDAFLLKLTTGGSYTWVRTWGGPDTERATSVDVGEYAFPYVCGTYAGTVDFAPPTADPDAHTSMGQWDSYVMKYLLNGEW